MLRLPAVSGAFYPAEPHALAALIHKYVPPGDQIEFVNQGSGQALVSYNPAPGGGTWSLVATRTGREMASPFGWRASASAAASDSSRWESS